jgi:hypothetical protein
MGEAGRTVRDRERRETGETCEEGTVAISSEVGGVPRITRRPFRAPREAAEA